MNIDLHANASLLPDPAPDNNPCQYPEDAQQVSITSQACPPQPSTEAVLFNRMTATALLSYLIPSILNEGQRPLTIATIN